MGFYVTLDSAWRPYQVFRHKIGTSVEDDVKVLKNWMRDFLLAFTKVSTNVAL